MYRLKISYSLIYKVISSKAFFFCCGGGEGMFSLHLFDIDLWSLQILFSNVRIFEYATCKCCFKKESIKLQQKDKSQLKLKFLYWNFNWWTKWMQRRVASLAFLKSILRPEIKKNKITWNSWCRVSRKFLMYHFYFLLPK